MFLSLLICQVTYFFICSSSRPTVLTQYPFAQKCRPQYRFFRSKCRSNTFIALFPFRNPITSATEYFGGNDITKCTWSGWTFPASISILRHSHSCRMISRIDFAMSPFRILNRYFGNGNGDAVKKVRKSTDQTVAVLMHNSLSPFHRKSHCRGSH